MKGIGETWRELRKKYLCIRVDHERTFARREGMESLTELLQL
jgi:hypothetical protein